MSVYQGCYRKVFIRYSGVSRISQRGGRGAGGGGAGAGVSLVTHLFAILPCSSETEKYGKKNIQPKGAVV